MNEILKDLMTERAGALPSPELDLAALTRAGDRRVRRRRTAFVGSVAALALAGGVALATLLPGDDGRGDQGRVAVDGSSASPQPLSWATGTTVHRAGMADLDLGVEIRAWLWVGEDIAFTDDQRRVLLWTGDAPDVLGATGPYEYDDTEPEIVTDRLRLGWLDREAGFLVHDTRSGEREVLSLEPTDSADIRPHLTALDGSTAYGVDGRGVFAWDTASGAVEVLDTDPTRAVIDAEDGVLLRKLDGQGVVARDGREISFPLDSFANLSPDGAVVTAESDDEGILVDTATGEPIAYDTGRDWAIPFQWLDDDTVAVLAMDIVEGDGEDARDMALTTCEVSTGTCDKDGEPVDGFRMELPIGIHFGDR